MKIEKTEYSYQVTECDLKFGEQIILDGELLIPASILDKIRAEVEQIELLARYTRGDIKQMALDVIDKYKSESEG